MLVTAPIPRFFARFGVCVFTLFSLIIPTLAQDGAEETPAPTPIPPLQMALSSPFALAPTATTFQLQVKRGRWFPIAVTLSNSGEPVSGTVRLRLVGGSPFENAPNEFYCPVDLPTNARKEVWLYGRLERPGVAGVAVSFEGRGFQSITQQVSVREPDEGQRVVLTVSDNDIGLSSMLLSLRGPGLLAPSVAAPTYEGAPSYGNPNPNYSTGSSQGPIRPLETPRAGIPDRWFGLETADLVVLGDFPHTALSPAQVESLRGFVAGGGTLVAFGGSNAARLSNSPLADLWPSKIGSSVSAGAGEVASLVKRYVVTAKNGADRLGGAPVVVTRGALKPNGILLTGSAAAPLAAQLDAGAGRTILLNFDPSQPPFVGWSGQAELWRSIFGGLANTKHLEGIDPDAEGQVSNFGGVSPYSRGGYGGYGGYNNGETASTPTARLLGALAKAPQLSMPPVSQIAWFLALYVFVLVPLNYAVLRFLDRRELAWVTIPVIVGAFSIFAYSAALSIRGSAILTRQIDVVQSSLGSKTARADSLLWLFSPKRTTYDVISSIPNAAVADYSNDAGAKQGAFSLLQPADATSFKVEDANVWMWTDRAFVSQSLLDLKNGLTLNGTTLSNGTPFDLQGVVWVQDREVRRVGALGSGASAAIPSQPTQRAMNVDMMGAIQQVSDVQTLFSTDAITNGIPHSALEAALGAGFGLDNAGSFCIAWAKTPLAPLSIGVPGARTSDLSLLVFRVPPISSKRLAAREAVVTRQAAQPILAPPNAAQATLPGSPRGFIGNLETFDCTLPDATSFVLEARGSGGTLTPNVYNSYPGAPPGYAPGYAVPTPTVSKGAARVKTPNLVKFEVWNPTSGRWTALKGNLNLTGTVRGGWTFAAPVLVALSRQPERLLQVRVRCESPQTHVSTLSVRRAEG